MEVEVVGVCLKFEDGDLIINDDGDLTNMDSSFFNEVDRKMILSTYIGKRVSFYYSSRLTDSGKKFDIMEISENDKQTCICYNHYERENFHLTQVRVLQLEHIIHRLSLLIHSE
jgi:hypothetical protein